MHMNLNRKRVLIRPRQQWRLVGSFLAAACISTIIQILLLNVALGNLASDLSADGAAVLDATPGIIQTQVLLTFGLMAPLVTAVGILESFRIFGPVHRFEHYLREIVAGRNPKPCSLRKEDELHDFCQLLNQATQLRNPAESGAPSAQEAEFENAPSLVQPRVEETTIVLD